MTLDELREREQQARARLGVGCENPSHWAVFRFSDDDHVEANHAADGINLALDQHGLSVSIGPSLGADGGDGETLRGFVPAETLVKMFTGLRAAIGSAAFKEIYGGIDEH